MPVETKAKTRGTVKGRKALRDDLFEFIIPDHLKLVPQLNEVYELQLAFYESKVLTNDEIIRNGAYFSHVGGKPTRHFLMCQGEPVKLAQHSSSRLRSFFSSNQFKTGYATHGLFPYRGKFHPQMIKGLINILGLKPGDTVLDPMMGSGTVLIEACLMGINSVGIDASPFCQFMTEAKLDGLKIPLGPIRKALSLSRETFDYFAVHFPPPESVDPRKTRSVDPDLFSDHYAKSKLPINDAPVSIRRKDVRNFLLLAYLDAIGYSLRTTRKGPYELFHGILERYLFVADKIQTVLKGTEHELATAKPMRGDARTMKIDDNSVDGIIFSPPYSFAIDYLENDEFHLRTLREDIAKLRTVMVGLRGSTKREQYDRYVEDMDRVLAECARVVKKGGLTAIVVGTNNNQISRILKIDPDKVKGIHEIMVDCAIRNGFKHVRSIERQITGMANTMRTEFIVILERT